MLSSVYPLGTDFSMIATLVANAKVRLYISVFVMLNPILLYLCYNDAVRVYIQNPKIKIQNIREKAIYIDGSLSDDVADRYDYVYNNYFYYYF